MISNQLDTDEMALQLWRHLADDFRSSLKNGDLWQNQENVLMTDVAKFRDVRWTQFGVVDPGKFKSQWQLESLLKKYRFANDKFDTATLEANTNSSYVSFQESLSAHHYESYASSIVLKRARKIMSGILGKFSLDEAFMHVRFGRRSSIGCPLRNAYLDEKVSKQKHFTSSTKAGSIFNLYLKDDITLRRILKQSRVIVRDSAEMNHNHLALVNVPKSWKTLRSITPLTLVDLFLTYGVGKMVEKRLCETGLNIKRLQNRHQALMRENSLSLRLATADLSRASDSITKTLLLRLLPRDWYNAIRHALCQQIDINGTMCFTDSVLPMGNGFTFPLETLVFYSLIKAIGDLANVTGYYSVYGDDLIYPSRLHKYVAWIFPQLHIQLNLDKTFCRYPFRESCGSDFYRGTDVRPFILEGTRQVLSGARALSFLYKTLNGLLRRWPEHLILDTVEFLKNEILRIGGTILRVPPSYPDSAGFKTTDLRDLPFHKNIVFGFKRGSRFIQFSWLSETSKQRRVEVQDIYYWNKLRSFDTEGDEEYGSQLFKPPSRDCGIDIAPEPQLLWVKVQHKRLAYKGRKFRWVPHVPDRQKSSLIHQTSTVSYWA